jgi:hypothetical protein
MKKNLIVLITTFIVGIIFGYNAKPEPEIWAVVMPAHPEKYQFTMEAAPFAFVSNTNPPKPLHGLDVVVFSYRSPFFSVNGRSLKFSLRRKNYVSLSSEHPLFEKIYLIPEGRKFLLEEGPTSSDYIVTRVK